MAKDIDFGQTPFELICRFIELSKNEIMVITLLYAHRNSKTMQCNPGRKLLCQESKLNKGNLSRTIANLEQKGWIAEDEKGNFTLFESYQIDNRKVIKLTTKKLSNLQPKVIKSTTESYQIDNSLNKDLNIEGTENGTEKENLAAIAAIAQTFNPSENLSVPRQTDSKTKTTRLPKQPDLAFERMASMCFRMDTPAERKMMSPKQRGATNQTLKIMRENECDLAFLQDFESWWKKDWRSKKENGTYQPPRPDQVRELWLEAIKAKSEEKPELMLGEQQFIKDIVTGNVYKNPLYKNPMYMPGWDPKTYEPEVTVNEWMNW